MSSSCSKQPTISVTVAAQRGMEYVFSSESIVGASWRESGKRDQAASAASRWASIMVFASSE